MLARHLGLVPRGSSGRLECSVGALWGRTVAAGALDALNAYRGLTKTMQSGIPGPEGSLGKWQWADINQRIAELALDIEGAYAPLARGDEHVIAGGAWQYSFLRSRANSIEGGTTDILKNIIAERVLGLPRMR